MKGDRFDQQCRKTYSADLAPVVAKALSKEHAAVRRMVNNTHKITVAAFKKSILAALDRMKKGEKK